MFNTLYLKITHYFSDNETKYGFKITIFVVTRVQHIVSCARI
jgi:hypothetical protein